MEAMPFPGTFMEAIRYFDDEERCRDFVADLRWPNGVECPREGCGANRVQFIATRGIWRCKECKRQFSVKVGTIFEDSAIGLDKWLTALWVITAHKKGISSYQLSKDIHVTQRTAWFMLHRLRLAMRTESLTTNTSRAQRPTPPPSKSLQKKKPTKKSELRVRVRVSRRASRRFSRRRFGEFRTRTRTARGC